MGQDFLQCAPDAVSKDQAQVRDLHTHRYWKCCFAAVTHTMSPVPMPVLRRGMWTGWWPEKYLPASFVGFWKLLQFPLKSTGLWKLCPGTKKSVGQIQRWCIRWYKAGSLSLIKTPWGLPMNLWVSVRNLKLVWVTHILRNWKKEHAKEGVCNLRIFAPTCLMLFLLLPCPLGSQHESYTILGSN